MAALDLSEALGGLALEQGGAAGVAAVAGGCPVLHQGAPGDVQFLHLVEPCADHGPHRWFEHGRPSREHGRVHRIGLGMAADRLREAPRLARVDLAEGQSGLGQLTFEAMVVGPGGLEDHARDRDLRQPGDQGAPTLAAVAEPARDPGRVQVDVQRVLGDVHADRLG